MGYDFSIGEAEMYAPTAVLPSRAWTPSTASRPTTPAPRSPTTTRGEWAICELVQRAAWAAEMGLDPRAVDLLALPPA